MPETNTPPCPTHGSLPRALHSENFEGIVTVIEEIIATVSGLGTVSYSRCPYGYPWSFEGTVRALEDLNTTISGIQTGGGGSSNILPGSGITAVTSGSYEIFDVNLVGIGGATVTYSGTTILISGQENTGIAIVSGVVGGLGISATASGGSVVIAQNSQGVGNVNLSYVGPTAVYSGITGPTSSVIVSGAPGSDYGAGSLWFDTNEGRLFVYASGNGVSDPAWYQANAEALAYKSEQPPSGAGFNAPPRDGSLWFNNLLGSLFVYDAVTSGWYETSSVRTPSYSSAAPAPVAEGVTWIDSTVPQLKVWDGTAWVNA
jgi:hypothetical protein